MSKDKTIKLIEDLIQQDNHELGKSLNTLLKDYTRKSERLDKILKIIDKQQLKVIELNEELKNHKINLELRVEEEIKKRQEKEKILLTQSRLASMGEMMDAVAHQWNQPLSIISMQVMVLDMNFEVGKIDQEYIHKFQEKINLQIKYMTDTLSEFRSFFRPSKNTVDFKINQAIDKVLLLVKDEFIKNTIKVKINCSHDFTIHGIENEFKHLIINLINNAKDAYIEKNIKDREILINILQDNEYNIIEVIDNAGGIPESIIESIFNANVTTKEEGKGTGIGLYMSSQIAKKHNGTLNVVNVENGAKFVFKIGRGK